MFLLYNAIIKEGFGEWNQDKMHLINKIFNNETIRTICYKENKKYYISVVDIVGIISESNNPQTYWRVFKKRLKDEENETVTNCNALKLKAQDVKYRLIDVVDIEGVLRIIESIPSKNAEVFCTAWDSCFNTILITYYDIGLSISEMIKIV